MTKLKLPLDDFFKLTHSESKRRDKIIESMEYLKTQFDDSEEWLRACLNTVPKNFTEALFVSYILGGATVGVMIAIENIEIAHDRTDHLVN